MLTLVLCVFYTKNFSEVVVYEMCLYRYKMCLDMRITSRSFPLAKGEQLVLMSVK